MLPNERFQDESIQNPELHPKVFLPAQEFPIYDNFGGWCVHVNCEQYLNFFQCEDKIGQSSNTIDN